MRLILRAVLAGLGLTLSWTPNAVEAQSSSKKLTPDKIIADLEETVRHIPTGAYNIRGRNDYYIYSGSLSFVRGRYVYLIISSADQWGGWTLDEVVLTTKWVYLRRGALTRRGNLTYVAWKSPVGDFPPSRWGRRNGALEFGILARTNPALAFPTLGPLALFPAKGEDADEVMLVRKRWVFDGRPFALKQMATFPVFVNLRTRRISALASYLTSGRRATVVDAPEAGGLRLPEKLDSGTAGLVVPILRYSARKDRATPDPPAWIRDRVLPLASASAPVDTIASISHTLGVDPSASAVEWLKAVEKHYPGSEIAWEALWIRAAEADDKKLNKQLKERMAHSDIGSRFIDLVSLWNSARDAGWEKTARIAGASQKSGPLAAVMRQWVTRAQAHQLSPSEFSAWLSETTDGLPMDDQLDWTIALWQVLRAPGSPGRSANVEVPDALFASGVPDENVPPALHRALSRRFMREKSHRKAVRHFLALAKHEGWLKAVLPSAAKAAEEVADDQDLCARVVEHGAVSLKLAARYLKSRAAEGELKQAAAVVERIIRSIPSVRPRGSYRAEEIIPGVGAGDLIEALEEHGLDELADRAFRDAVGLPWFWIDERYKQMLKERLEGDPARVLDAAKRRGPGGLRTTWSLFGLDNEDAVTYLAEQAEQNRLGADWIPRIFELRHTGLSTASDWKALISALVKQFPKNPLAWEIRGDLHMGSSEYEGALENYAEAIERPVRVKRELSLTFFSLARLESDPLKPRYHRLQPLWIKLALAADGSSQRERGIELLKRFGGTAKSDFSYQAVGRAYEILGEKELARRQYWLALLSGEAHIPGRTWTISFPIDEIARRCRDQKDWEQLLIAARIAGRSDVAPPARSSRSRNTTYSREALTARIDKYLEEARKKLAPEELIADLVREHKKVSLGSDAKKRVNTLLKDLASEDAGARDKAMSALREMGPSISPYLARELRSTDAERAKRVQMILEPWAIDAIVRKRVETLPWP